MSEQDSKTRIFIIIAYISNSDISRENGYPVSSHKSQHPIHPYLMRIRALLRPMLFPSWNIEISQSRPPR